MAAVPGSLSAQENGSLFIFYQDPFTGGIDFGACEGDAIFSSPSAAFFNAQLWFCPRGASAAGITGVEGYFDGPEATGWTFTFTPVEGTVSIGSFTEPHDANGDSIPDARVGNFAFTSGCKRDDFIGMVQLGTLSGTQDPVETPIPNDTWIRFVAGSPPRDGAFPCPLVTLCDGPVFTAICVAGGSFLINPRNDSFHYCPRCRETAVRVDTWTAVKRLYRDSQR